MNMLCECGYRYSNQTGTRAEPYKSYALVDDKDYQKFLEMEVKIHQLDDGPAKWRAVARASGQVGRLLECPQCSRLLLIKPGANSPGCAPVFYIKEEARPPA